MVTVVLCLEVVYTSKSIYNFDERSPEFLNLGGIDGWVARLEDAHQIKSAVL
jgi:hypothetical protein